MLKIYLRANIFDFLKITMHSPHDDNHSMYIVNLESGATEIVEIPDDVIFDKPYVLTLVFSPSFIDLIRFEK